MCVYRALQLSDEYDSASLVFSSERTTWYRPTTLDELLELKHEHPDARLVVGNTEVGQCRYRGRGDGKGREDCCS